MVQRVYRPDRRCPHCGSHWMPKAGFSRGKQTYRCGECHHRPSPEGNRHCHSSQVKGQAWEMYGEGLSIAAIRRVLGLAELTAHTWIKKSPSSRGRTGALGRGAAGGAGSGAAGGGHLAGRNGDLLGTTGGAGKVAARDLDGGD